MAPIHKCTVSTEGFSVMRSKVNGGEAVYGGVSCSRIILTADKTGKIEGSMSTKVEIECVCRRDSSQ